MKVGTVETIEEKEKKRKIRSSLTSGFGSNGGNRNGGGGGGSDGGDNNSRNNDSFEEAETYSSNKFRIAMWFLLLVVLMTFGGLISAYVVISTNGVMEWKPFDLPIQVWISTNLILASSITYTISQKALNLENQEKAKKWLLATTVFGGMFIASQILSWLELVRRGVYVESNPYAGFFYILTGVHAIHVVGGIAVLGYVVLRTWHKTSSDEELSKRKTISNAVGWYWHFMDALWIVLFLLLGFWK
ncbi:MAG TPA: heme-copper oxidase subunit III [Pyrinomonadaceae bacterium]|nr:heme-copper oxidase subunit III [Pyrinomonadaceae bacterium]